MSDIRARVAASLLAGLAGAGCGDSGPKLSGPCQYECLNQVRHLFEMCTSPPGTACQAQAMDSENGSFCFDDGNKVRKAHFLASGVLDTTTLQVYSGGALCVSMERTLTQNGFDSDTYFRDANGNDIAEICSVGVDGADPIGKLYCGRVAETIDPADRSCFPYGAPGFPAYVRDDTASCVAGGCVVP